VDSKKAKSGRASPHPTKKKGEAPPMQQLILKSCDKHITFQLTFCINEGEA
jgi:hypothetical protein